MKYDEPKFELVELDNVDILTASDEIDINI